MKDKYEILVPGSTYHVYNRAVGNEKAFQEKENYKFFLEKYKEYIAPYADTFCHCLMPNHFHFLIRIKEKEELEEVIKSFKASTGFETLSKLDDSLVSKIVNQQFSNLFNSYTQAFNKVYKRKGGLFMRPYKRIRVNDIAYLTKLVHYIHNNPVEGGYCMHPNQWPFSSYQNILNSESSFLKKEEVISWFFDKANFIESHQMVSLRSIHY